MHHLAERPDVVEAKFLERVYLGSTAWGVVHAGHITFDARVALPAPASRRLHHRARPRVSGHLHSREVVRLLAWIAITLCILLVGWLALAVGLREILRSIHLITVFQADGMPGAYDALRSMGS